MSTHEEIKPDTSLYKDLPSRLRAMALLEEARIRGEPIQYRWLPNHGWGKHTGEMSYGDDKIGDYRIAPKPVEIFALRYGETGSLQIDGKTGFPFCFQSAEAAYKHSGGHFEVVRFVEAQQ